MKHANIDKCYNFSVTNQPHNKTKYLLKERNNNMKKYKLRIYYKSGINKGNLEKEEFFDTIGKAQKRYNELFNYNDFGLNPTLWELNKETSEYNRILGY